MVNTTRTPKYDSCYSGAHSARVLMKHRAPDKSAVTPTKPTRPSKTGACTTPTLKNIETRRASRDATWKKETRSLASTPVQAKARAPDDKTPNEQRESHNAASELELQEFEKHLRTLSRLQQTEAVINIRRNSSTKLKRQPSKAD